MSPLIVDATTCVVFTAILGLTFVIWSSVSTTPVSSVSKAPTTTFGWLRQQFNRYFSSSLVIEYNPRDPITDAVVVHSEQQYRSVSPASFPNRTDDKIDALFAMNEVVQKESRKEHTEIKKDIIEMKENMAEMKEDMTEIKEDMIEMKEYVVDNSRNNGLNSIRVDMIEKGVEILHEKVDDLKEEGNARADDHETCLYIICATAAAGFLYSLS